MSSLLHGNAPLGEVHIPYNWSYADAAARAAATGFVADDVGKLARQLDDNSLWMLTDESPITWVQVGGSAAPTNATYIVQTASSGLSAEQALSSLSTGLAVVTNGTGVISTVAAPSGTVVGTSDSQTLTNKTLTTPTIASFANATHNHTNAAGGGQITDAALSAAVGLAKGGTNANLSATGPGTLIQASNGANVSLRLDNLSASAAPAVTDDSGDGYSIGSRWLDTTADKEYVALDVSVGAAVWKETTVTTSGSTVDIEDEGSAEGAADTIDFVGAGVSVSFAGGTATVSIPGSGGAPDYICIVDEKAQNTNGGTLTLGAWRTRDLNTERSDSGGHASVASNQITLAAGTYEVRISTPGYYVDKFQSRLQDITNTATLIVGTSEYSGNTNDGTQSRSFIAGKITLAGSTVLEVQIQCQTTKTTDGMGVAANFTTEVYTVCEFWKVA